MSASALGPPEGRVSASLLTGFLGSGKTTLLNRLLVHPAMGETAVIVNEFGAVPLDHLLVATSTENLAVLASGCVCCSVRDDLYLTMLDLWQRRARGELPRFTRLLVETTGLADPAPILRTVMADPEVGERYWLDAVLTTVDAVNAASTLERQWESVKQVAVADRLLLTKSDLAGESALVELEARLRAINPGAPQIVVVHGAVEPDVLFDVALFHERAPRADVDGWLRDEVFDADPWVHGWTGPAAAPPAHAHAGIESFCIVREAPLPMAVFEAWLAALVDFRGPDLLRVKGIVHVRELDRPAVFHCVQHAFHPPLTLDAWPSADRRTRIVFVTRGIPKLAVEAALDRVLDAGPA